jgi:hypothetical protein
MGTVVAIGMVADTTVAGTVAVIMVAVIMAADTMAVGIMVVIMAADTMAVGIMVVGTMAAITAVGAKRRCVAAESASTPVTQAIMPAGSAGISCALSPD